MSLFENVIGSKTNFVRTDKNNTLTGENTFNGDVIFEGNINGLEISDIPNLQTELNNKVNLSELQTEINERETADTFLQNNISELQSSLDLETQNRIDGDYLNQQNIILEGQTRAENDATLQANINLKANQTDLDTEINDRTTGDETLLEYINGINTNMDNLQYQIDLKLNEANSNYNPNYSFYCVDNQNDLFDIIPLVTNQGSTISVSSGSFGSNAPLTIDKNNLAIYSVPSTPPICEFACLLTIPSTANRIRFNYLSFDNEVNLSGKRCVYSNSTFNNNVIIGEGTTEYMTFANCEFSAGKTITFSATMASVVYVIECNIAGASLVFNNASPLQVIFSNCSGFVSLPTTSQATLIGLNVKADGTIIQHNISKIVLPTGEGTNNQVLTSTGSGNCIWSTPSSGGGGSDIIKERFSRYTLGQTVSTSQGNITLENVTTELLNNGTSMSWIELTGSNINYTPPANCSVVEYELTFYAYSSGTATSGIGLQFYIDNVAQTITRAKQPLVQGGTSTYGQMRYTFKTTIEINGTTDATKCWVNNWNTSKNLKLRVSKLDSPTMSFHRVTTLFTDNPVQNTNTIVAPLLTITAY